MDSELQPYLLFESPSEYYATCARFFGNLAQNVPEFYSDNTLVVFCCYILPYEDSENEDIENEDIENEDSENEDSGNEDSEYEDSENEDSDSKKIRQSHPKLPPSHDTEVLLYTASKLRLEPYDWVTTGPILEKTVRAILKDFGLDSPVATLAQLLARLSFVVPKVLVFPDAAEVEPEDRAFYSYRRLCVHLAQQLLPLPLFSEGDGQVFEEQLRNLSEYDLNEQDECDLLPCISLDDVPQTPLEDEWFEQIEAAALELTEHENGEDILRSAPQIIQRGIDALSQAVEARPPFPNVEALLTEYCEENGGNPWRYPLESPTPRPLLWEKDFFTQADGPRIQVANTADPTPTDAQQQQSPVKRFRVRRDLAWPEDKTA